MSKSPRSLQSRLLGPLILVGLFALLVYFFMTYMQQPGQKYQPDGSEVNLENFILLKIKTGTAIIKLEPEKAPKHVERIRKLVREGFYNGLKFHRVIDGFMAQTGDPTGTGTGGSNYPDLDAEFSDIPFNRGTIGAARTNNPNSANSQFFICFQSAPHLNGIYTVWGRVVWGMEHVDRLAKGNLPGGMVQNPDVIEEMVMAADAKSAPPVPLRKFVDK